MSQLITKFIQDNAVTDIKMRLRNNLALRARNAANTADVEILKINTSDILEVLRELSMGNQKITNLLDPSNPLDAANKQYVDSVISGLSDPKDATRVASTSALPAATYDNGVAGVGATLTADANGALPSIDSVGLSLNDRILLKDQTSALENGIYIVSDLGSAGTPWVLTRSGDADNSGSGASAVTQGMFVPVAEGQVNGALGFLLTSPDPITLGVTGLAFTQFGESIQAGSGLLKNGQIVSVDAGDGLGFSGNQLVVLVDDDLVNGTTKMVGGVLVGRRTFEEEFTLTGTDISNGYVDLSKVASNASAQMHPRLGIRQKRTVDFTVSATGGAGGKTRLTWIGDFATLVEVGDVIDVAYESLDY